MDVNKVTNEIKKIFIPTLLSYSIYILLELVDSAFISILFGVEAQSSLSLLRPLTLITSFIAWIIIVGGNTYFGIALGKKDTDEANEVYNISLIYGAISIAVIVLLLNIFLGKYIGIYGYAVPINNLIYIRVILFSRFLLYISNALGFFARTFGFAQKIMIESIIAVVVNVILNFVFAMVFELGIVGIGIATILTCICQVSYLAYSVVKLNSNVLKVRYVKFKWKLFMKLCFNGFSDSFFDVANAVVLFICNLVIIKHLGVNGLAILYVITQVASIQQCIAFSLSDSLNPIFSRLHGAKESLDIIQIRDYAVKRSIYFGVLIFVVTIIARPLLFDIYNVDTSLLSLTTKASLPFWATIIFFGANQVLLVFYTSIDESLTSMIIAVIRSLLLPVLFVLVLETRINEGAVWYGMLFAEATSTLLITIYTYHCSEHSNLTEVEK